MISIGANLWILNSRLRERALSSTSYFYEVREEPVLFIARGLLRAGVRGSVFQKLSICMRCARQEMDKAVPERQVRTE